MNLHFSMAVEPPHISLFPTRDISHMIDQGNGRGYDDRIQTAYGMAPLPVTKTDKKLLPMYASGLTSSIPLSRKRSRDDDSSFNPPVFSLPNAHDCHQIGTFTFLSQDITPQIYQQQLEIDRFISQHTEKVRSDIEEMRRRNNRRLIAVAEEGIMKRLKAKEEEIMKMGQLNWSLEEKVKSLCVENQIWRELAQTNEATANALRNNLQQLLAQVQLQQQQQQHLEMEADNAGKAATTALIDDAQSQCGSNYEEEDENYTRERKVKKEGECRYGRLKRWCRKCGKEESCVLLLPCRHLCICTICASSITICPLCKSTNSAALHVNIN